MPLIGDFVAGAGAVGAQMSMEALRSTIEEERATRLAEMQNKFQVARDASEQGFRRGERVAGQDFQTSTAATTRANALADAPVLAGVQTDAQVRAEREKRLLPPAAISEEDKAEKNARADYLKANAERLRAETGAIQRGERYGARGAGGTPQSEKDAKLASSEVISLMKNEKDETGAPRYGSQAVMQYAAIASGLVRSGGYTPQEAAQLARNAPIRSQAEITAQIAEEEKKLPKVGMIRGALTGGGVEGGDVEGPDGKTMKLEDWRKQRGAQIMAEDEKKLAGWAKDRGIQLTTARAPTNGAPYPDGTVLEKDGEKYEVRDGKPVKMEAAKAPDQPASVKPAAAEPGDALLTAGRAMEATNPELKALGNQMRLMDGGAAASARAAYLQMVRDLQSGKTARKPLIPM